MPLLHITTGKENNANSSATINAFIHLAGKEAPVFSTKPAHKALTDRLSSVGRPSVYQARRGIKASVGGSWVASDYNVVEGTFIKVAASKSVPNMRLTSQFILYCREGAAMQRVTIPLNLTHASTVEEAVIEGRFDIMTLEQAKSRGFEIAPHFESFFNSLMFERLASVTVIEPQREPLPSLTVNNVVTESGDVVSVRSKVRKRNLST